MCRKQQPVDEQSRFTGVVEVEDLCHSLDEEPVAGLRLDVAPSGYVGLGKQLHEAVGS